MIHFRLLLSALCVASLAVSCSGPGDRVEVTDTANRSPYRPPIKLDAPASERFAMALRAQPMGAPVDSGAGQEDLFHYDLPAGWSEAAATSMRLINLRFGANGESECYLSLLPGGGGGLTANVNRWRRQMGLDEVDEATIASYPTVTIFQQAATLIDIEGTFSGMTPSEPRENYRLIGALLIAQGEGIFVKMVGPAADLEGLEQTFADFLLSIHVGTGHSHGDAPVAESQLPAGHPDISPSASGAVSPTFEGAGHGESGGFSWTAPEGWTQAGERPMRVVTFTLGETGETECYVSVLGAGGGGELMNVNRWLGQFGADPINENALAQFPELSLLGQPAKLIETRGTYTGMGGNASENYALLGAMTTAGDQAVFVKMVGPLADVGKQRDQFVAFTESIHTH